MFQTATFSSAAVTTNFPLLSCTSAEFDVTTPNVLLNSYRRYAFTIWHDLQEHWTDQVAIIHTASSKINIQFERSGQQDSDSQLGVSEKRVAAIILNSLPYETGAVGDGAVSFWTCSFFGRRSGRYISQIPSILTSHLGDH